MRSLRTYTLVVLFVVALLTAAQAETRPRHRRAQRKKATVAKRVKRVIWNPLFAGSHDMLVRQNQQLDQLELPRIANDTQLEKLEEAGALVPVATTSSLVVASNLRENRRYCRPWTREFLVDLGEAYHRQFGQPIVATSLVRTADQQKKLRRRNRNAAPQEGETASTHLTGVTVDLLKRGMTRQQHHWLENYFLPLKEAGLVEPIEERRQPVFHVVVFDTYSAHRERQYMLEPRDGTEPPPRAQASPEQAPVASETPQPPANTPENAPLTVGRQRAAVSLDATPTKAVLQVSAASTVAP